LITLENPVQPSAGVLKETGLTINDMFAHNDRVYVQTTDQVFVLDTTDSLNVLYIVELSSGTAL